MYRRITVKQLEELAKRNKMEKYKSLLNSEELELWIKLTDSLEKRNIHWDCTFTQK